VLKHIGPTRGYEFCFVGAFALGAVPFLMTASATRAQQQPPELFIYAECLAIAFAIITFLHIVLGELALRHSEGRHVGYDARAF
jgi:hypothetical protein